MDTLVRASELIEYSKIRLYTPLGGTYVATVEETVLEITKVTIHTLVGEENNPGPTIECDPKLTVVEVPDLTPYGLVKNFIKVWKAKAAGTERDEQWVAAAEMLSELEDLLPGVLKAHEVVKKGGVKG